MRRAWSPDRLLARGARRAAPGHPGMLLRPVGDGYDAAVPRLRLVVVCCMDCRLDPLAVLRLRTGDAHVFRNAGGRVTPEAVASVDRSQRVFGTTGVVVLGHTDCRNLEVPGNPVASVRRGIDALRRSGIPHRAGVGGAVADLGTGAMVPVEPWATAGAAPSRTR